MISIEAYTEVRSAHCVPRSWSIMTTGIGCPRMLRLLFIVLLAACRRDAPPAEAAKAVDSIIPPPRAAADSAVPTRSTGALQRLAAADSRVQWDAASAQEGDVDCDGVPDSAFVGRTKTQIHVGLVRAFAPRPEIVEFGVSSREQASVCDANATLALESQDFDDEDGLEGFQRSTTCKGMSLADGLCDSIHLYWNRKTQQLGWSRN